MAANKNAKDGKEQTAEQKDEVQQTAENQTNAQTEKPADSENTGQQGEADKDAADADKTDEADSEKEKAKTVKLTLRHKSHTPHYHRCGLTLTKTFAEYEVSEDCVERIKGDKWIEVKDAK